MAVNREVVKENKYIPPHFGDNSQDGVTGNREATFGRRDVGHGHEGRHQWNHMGESSSSRGIECNTRDRYVSEQSNRYRVDALQDSSASKSLFSSGGNGFHINDPTMNFSREKRSFSKSERPYLDDPFLKEVGTPSFDERDPFSGGLVGVIKRKKDVVKQADFHDPVRESFEAELERVQKMQEQERQRIIEEQERALEQARREEEEKLRLIREEQERRRRLEEEAREAAWRAEQERLEAFRRAEEQKIAREEEKQRILLEEERRKQAAKQKLLELEAKIAKRQFEEPKGDSSAGIVDEKVSAVVTERDISRAVDLDNWEDSERMVERLTTSGSSDSSALNRPFELGPRSQTTRECSYGFLDKGKPANSWRRDVFEDVNSSAFLVQNQDNDHHSPRRDVSVGGRAVTRKELHGGGSYMSSRTHVRGGMQEHHMEDFARLKGQRWSGTGDGDSFSRNTEVDPEFHENVTERYGDVARGLGRTRGNPRSPYPDRLNFEADELYSYGRSRYSMRQPRVLPPPSIASVHKTSFRGDNEHPGPSTFLDNNKHHSHASRSEPIMQNVYYSGQHEESETTEVVDVQPENTLSQDQKLEKKITPRCASQSSLSVSSPPNSPTPLSHDDLDESGDSPVASVVTEGKDTPFSVNESVVLNGISGKDAVVTASSSISGADDEDWALENNEELQEQEEYDEDEDGYQEEDEVHEGDDEHLDLTQEFDDLDLEERGSRMMDNLVLGFDEGVEVGIPSDEFERSPRNLESSFGIPEVSFGTIEEQGPVDGMQGDGHCLQPLDSSPRMRIESSSRRIQETEKAIQDSAAQPINTAAHTSPTCEPLDSVDASNSSGVCSQLAVPSSVNMTLHSSSQTVMSTLPVAPSQPDLPVKLQFGLFSGPSLIPSPVPAIQIGSIQMPLHLHPPVGSSLTHICPPQPPLFQFGQLRYTSPISQGILPVAPQSVSFIQSNVQAYHNLNQSSGGPLPIQPRQDSSTHNLIKDDVPSVSMDRECTESNALIHNQAENAGQNKVMSERDSRAEDKRNQDTVVKDYIPSSNGSVSEGHLQTAPLSSQSIWTEKDFRGSKAEGPLSGNRGKKIAYPARNPDLRSSFPTSEASRSDSRGFQRRPRWTIQRTEFRVRENVDWRQSPGLGSSNSPRQVDKSNFTGREVGYFVKSGSKKGLVGQKPLKQLVEHECSSSDQVSYQGTDSGVRLDKRIEKEASTRTQSAGEANLTRNMYSEEDVDAPLQSGIVRVFNQPGIEATSDGDDFIEVRSKRQMLNDRREQREKEIKAKYRVTKGPRKPQSLEQDAVVSTSSNRTSASLDGEAPNKIHSNIEAPEERVLVNREVSTGFTTMVSQTLAPIGTPVAANSDNQADKRPHNIKSLQKAPTSVISNCGKNLGPSLMFETKSKILDNVQTCLGTWGNAQINQQVMALTQTQLDEAMKPGRFDTCVASIGDHASSGTESFMPLSSSSILAKDKAFSSAASPINSLLSGEKIQFGAVTSPTVLPPGSCTVSHGMGAPGSSRSDIQLSHNLSGVESDCTLFFGKDKHQNESCVHLEDCAAASAVAVAAIGSDEIVGNVLGTCSVSVSDSKSFTGTDVDGISGGATGEQQLATQSRADESLSVALPADLSVDNSAVSLWPPLPSPQNSSSQMLSHFPGGPPSHFPFYEMNPMLGGPIFAFGPHDESAGIQSQSQNNTAASGPLGTWQQCHSGVDSFYGPPAGFSGPFISPPGSIPGVQGPPHMVVYNHFPVGQFGQVGLSFMGTTYIPSGKQPDWKHNPTSSAMGTGKGDMNNINMVSAQRNPLKMASPVRHLSPGSPLLPIVSPFAMLDVSPFQSALDMSVQGHWSHVPASPLHSIPLSLPFQQPETGVLPSQFSQGHLVDQSLTANRFSESRTSTPSDISQSFPVATDSTVTQFPDELGLVDSSSSTGAGASTQGAIKKSSSGSTFADVGKTDTVQNVSSNNGNGQSRNAFKNQSAQQFCYSTGYNYQRGGVSQKNNSTGSEWSHGGMGFHGRNHSLCAEKSYPSAKVKQIYVAKQNTSGTSTVG
ncbi:Chitinase-like protein [Actinidia chinensis var. chinensis]|uniref:Chitinase-like protein n=1 Tax=Actinidia chinensis var. chinensis TaxID=1590841 RepID=A0A2R6S1D5_ACTCC|nr:Chitinase-like protein [Actinidia chinensis var. chinensis]